MSQISHLDRLAILQVDFDIWSGQTKLDDPDVKIGVGGELPPKEFASLGQKFLIDKKHLLPFNRLKTEARRLCLAIGMPFMNGFAVPLDKIDGVCAELDKIAQEMDSLKVDFVDKYPQYVNEWLIKNPDYADAIREGTLPKEVVENRIGFDYQVFQVNPVNDAQSKKLNSMASGLSDVLMDEIVDEANKFFHSNLKGRDTVGTTTKKTLKRLLDKVEGLSFLDSRFLKVVELLNNTLNGYVGFGKVVHGEPFYKILSATLILSSKDKINEYAEGTINIGPVGATSHGFSIASTSVASNTLDLFDDQPIQDNQVMPVSLPDDDDIDAFFSSFKLSEDTVRF